jgi:hypothetical protein
MFFQGDPDVRRFTSLPEMAFQIKTGSVGEEPLALAVSGRAWALRLQGLFIGSTTVDSVNNGLLPGIPGFIRKPFMMGRSKLMNGVRNGSFAPGPDLAGFPGV